VIAQAVVLDIARSLSRWGHVILPAALIGIGLAILFGL